MPRRPAVYATAVWAYSPEGSCDDSDKEKPHLLTLAAALPIAHLPFDILYFASAVALCRGNCRRERRSTHFTGIGNHKHQPIARSQLKNREAIRATRSHLGPDADHMELVQADSNWLLEYGASTEAQCQY